MHTNSALSDTVTQVTVRNARRVTIIGSEAFKIASTSVSGSLLLAGPRMVHLGNCGDSRWWALPDDPVLDGKMAFDERLLKQDREAETLHIACIIAVREQGEPFMFGGACLRERDPEKLLGHAAGLLGCFGEAEDGGWEPP